MPGVQSILRFPFVNQYMHQKYVCTNYIYIFKLEFTKT